MATTKVQSELIASTVPLGRRNILYNGAMQIRQRVLNLAIPTTTVTGIGNGDSGYHVQDRWKFTEQGSVGGVLTMSQSTTTPDGFGSSMKFECTTAEGTVAADEEMRFEQAIEGQDLQVLNKGDAQAKSLTLSFWVNATKTGINTITLYDGDNSRSISKAYTVDVTNTWEYKTITFAGDTTGGAVDNDTAASLQILWRLVAGANFSSGTLNTSWGSHVAANQCVGQVNNLDTIGNLFHITGVQLELGDTATEFEHRTFGEELLGCQRYYNQRAGTNAVMYSNSGGSGAGKFTYSHWQFHVEMRAAPTMSGATGTEQQVNKNSAGVFNSAGSYAIWGEDSTADAEL